MTTCATGRAQSCSKASTLAATRQEARAYSSFGRPLTLAQRRLGATKVKGAAINNLGRRLIGTTARRLHRLLSFAVISWRPHRRDRRAKNEIIDGRRDPHFPSNSVAPYVLQQQTILGDEGAERQVMTTSDLRTADEIFFCCNKFNCWPISLPFPASSHEKKVPSTESLSYSRS